MLSIVLMLSLCLSISTIALEMIDGMLKRSGSICKLLLGRNAMGFVAHHPPRMGTCSSYALCHCPAPLPTHIRIPNAGGWPASMRRMPAQAVVAMAGFSVFMLKIKCLCEYRAPTYIGVPFGCEAARLRCMM